MLQISHNFLVKSKDTTRAPKWHQLHIATLPWFKANSGASGNIQSHAARCVTVKIKGGVCFGKMVMTADLHGAITSVGDHQGHAIRAFIRVNVPSAGKISPGIIGASFSELGCGQ
jgi:hypothetical protein